MSKAIAFSCDQPRKLVAETASNWLPLRPLTVGWRLPMRKHSVTTLVRPSALHGIATRSDAHRITA